jgi:hypothetical protein
LGDAVAPVGEALGDAFRAVAGILPGGDAAVWALLGGAVVAAAVLAAARMTDRTLVDRASPRRQGSDPGAPDARALETAAEEAERAGRYEQAVRLRFQAGLLRLDEVGLVPYQPSRPNAAVSRRLGSPTFDALARRFEEVAYGGRAAEAADVGRAREAWPLVLGRGARR